MAQEKNLMLELFQEFIRRDYEEGVGNRYCRLIQGRLEELKGKVDDRGSKAVRRHIHGNILPVVASFQILCEAGLSEEEARKRSAGWMHEIAEKRADSFRRMANLPFFYSLFRRICPGFMAKNYPVEGWEMRFHQRDKERIAFDCHRCVYLDVTTELGCPELCMAFCENDDITFGALKPKVHFVRTKTLAGGGDCCDFRLVNGKYMNDKA